MSGQPQPESASHGVILVDAPHPGRWLRGDFAPIDLLLLVHDDTWGASLDIIIEHVAASTPIEVLVQDAAVQGPHYARGVHSDCVGVAELPHDTPWIRDYGPLQVLQGNRTVWVDFPYGVDRGFDDGIPEVLGERFGADLAFESAQLDGGGIVSNGRGLCAVTDLTLLESGLATGDDAVVREFARRLGCPALAVVPSLPEEQTGHADVTIQFLSTSKVAVAWMAPATHPLQSALLDQTVEILEFAADRIGQPLEVVRVPMTATGEIFYSYLNGTRVADMFLVPRYDKADASFQEAAYSVLQANMPGVRLVQVPADAMVELGGAVHCITLGLSIPAPSRPRCAPRTAERVDPRPLPRRRARARVRRLL